MHRLIALSFCIALAACANAQPDQMVSTGGTPLPQGSPLRAGISVGDVAGATGHATADIQSSVTTEAFSEALRETLAARGMLAQKQSGYVLAAEIIDLKQPQMRDLEMHVGATVRYALSTSAARLVFVRTVHTDFTADWRRTLKSGERLQLATEGAMRENIRAFLEQLIAAARTGRAFKHP